MCTCFNVFQVYFSSLLHYFSISQLFGLLTSYHMKCHICFINQMSDKFINLPLKCPTYHLYRVNELNGQNFYFQTTQRFYENQIDFRSSFLSFIPGSLSKRRRILSVFAKWHNMPRIPLIVYCNIEEGQLISVMFIIVNGPSWYHTLL